MVIKLIHIKPEHIKRYIYLAFKDDADLPIYHIKPGTLKEMSEHNYHTVIDAKDTYNAEYFKIVKESNGKEENIGFSVAVKSPIPMLVSFGINIMHRTKEVLSGWLDALRIYFGDNGYGIGLWGKNERAIRFFERNAIIVHRQESMINNNKFIVLWL